MGTRAIHTLGRPFVTPLSDHWGDTFVVTDLLADEIWQHLTRELTRGLITDDEYAMAITEVAARSAATLPKPGRYGIHS